MLWFWCDGDGPSVSHQGRAPAASSRASPKLHLLPEKIITSWKPLLSKKLKRGKDEEEEAAFLGTWWGINSVLLCHGQISAFQDLILSPSPRVKGPEFCLMNYSWGLAWGAWAPPAPRSSWCRIFLGSVINSRLAAVPSFGCRITTQATHCLLSLLQLVVTTNNYEQLVIRDLCDKSRWAILNQRKCLNREYLYGQFINRQQN